MSTAACIGLLSCTALLAACSPDSSLQRGTQLLQAGKTRQGLDVLHQGLQNRPHDAALQAQLHQGLQTELDGLWQSALAYAEAGRFEQAFGAARAGVGLLQHYPQQAGQDNLDPAGLSQRSEEVVKLLVRGAQVRTARLLQQRHPLRAAALCDATAAFAQTPQASAWARRTKQQAFSLLHRITASLQVEHPATAAVQLALAKQLGDTCAQRSTIARAWKRFCERACFAPPQVEVRRQSALQGPADLVGKLRQATAMRLGDWSSRCGRGSRPLSVQVVIDDIDVVEQSSTAPAAVARAGQSLQTETASQDTETLSQTQEAPAWQTRTRLQTHRDCPVGGREADCRTWQQAVQEQVPVQRLEVHDTQEQVPQPTLRADLPADAVVPFERVTAKRRITVRGHVCVDGATFAAQPFAVTARSHDSSHAEVRDRDSGPLLAADPMEVKSLEQLSSEVAAETARAVALAVHEAAHDWAEDRGSHAAQIEEMQPEEAEELYLGMLALGLDDGSAIRNFFQQRYGEPVDAVLTSLSIALGRPPHSDNVDRQGAAKADLSLLFP